MIGTVNSAYCVTWIDMAYNAMTLLLIRTLLVPQLSLHWAAIVYRVDVSLVEIHQEDDIIPKNAQSVHRGHLDDEGEEVVDEGIDEFVHQVSPREPAYTL